MEERNSLHVYSYDHRAALYRHLLYTYIICGIMLHYNLETVTRSYCFVKKYKRELYRHFCSKKNYDPLCNNHVIPVAYSLFSNYYI